MSGPILTAFAVAAFAVLGAVAGLGCARLLARGAGPAPIAAAPCACGVGVLWAFAAARWQEGALPGWWLPVVLGVSTVAVPLAAADLRHHRLPDVLTVRAYPVFAVLIVVAATGSPDGGLAARGLAGALVFAAAHTVVHLVSPRSMGAGDVKLSGTLGAVLGAVGWTALVVAACLAAVVTALLAVRVLLRRGTDRQTHTGDGHCGARRSGVPHGPGMLVATWLLSVLPGAGAGVTAVG